MRPSAPRPPIPCINKPINRTGASGEERQSLRKTSFALTNIIFFPIFRLIMDLWEKYRADKVDWHTDTEWRDCIARLAGEVSVDVNVPDPEDPDKKIVVKKKVPIMGRDYAGDATTPECLGNPAWKGSVLLQNYDKDGNPTTWGLSSTRQTRDAAYHYIIQMTEVDLKPKA